MNKDSIFDIVYNCETEKLNEYLKENSDIKNIKNIKNQTLLMLATSPSILYKRNRMLTGNEIKKMVDSLISNDCDINAQDDKGNTALLNSIESHNFTATLILLGTKSIDVKIRNNFGDNALMLLMQTYWEINKELLEEIFSILIKMKIDINEQTYIGNNALKYAIQSGNLIGVKLLYTLNTLDIKFLGKNKDEVKQYVKDHTQNIQIVNYFYNMLDNIEYEI